MPSPLAKDGLMPADPEQVDMSLGAMEARLVALQPSLRAVIGSGDELFDDFYDLAPHQREARDGFPVYKVYTANLCPETGLPMGRELTIVLGAHYWVRVFRTMDSAPDAYPRERVWLWRPHEAAQRKTDIFFTHIPARVCYPYEVETMDYDEHGMCVGTVGTGYVDQEPLIAQTSKALSDARHIAGQALLCASVASSVMEGVDGNGEA